MDISINVSKLHQELKAAKLPVISVHSDGRVVYSRALTKEELNAAKGLIETHNPAPDTPPTTDDLVRALWAKIMDGDSTKADELAQQLSDLHF